MNFMNDNDFMLEMTDEELNEINGAGLDGFSSLGACCGVPAFTSIPFVGACGTCGFGVGPFIQAFSNEFASTRSFNLSFSAATVKKTSFFTLIG